MSQEILIIALFTMLVHAIDTSSYAIRLAGIRISKIAVSLSLAGVVVILSRTSNLFQGVFTAGIFDDARAGRIDDIISPLRTILFSASAGTLLAILLFPTLVFISARLIAKLELTGSVFEMIRLTVTFGNIKRIKKLVRIPKLQMLARLRVGGLPKRLLLLNCLVTAIYTVGVLAAMYSGVLIPEHLTRANMSSGLINGVATIIFAMFVDPQLAVATDRALAGKTNIETLNKMFGLILISRLVGTLLAQLLLIPAAYTIKWFILTFFATN
ncbi:lipid II flippase Amj family protein [Paenibacillus sp. N1-5-1-14]|uniref:lipid II flippase Amj family protein n=1 Tax=Paenibacillus radicibacter TaxID=2972488 RepID=UPI002159365E|nr:lipid II flippase Amj family protein [Paenibacillus radicibacter]MCR8644928.1 lipid II flippase Amj family protein [Paenibacillus radicibacter]